MKQVMLENSWVMLAGVRSVSLNQSLSLALKDGAIKDSPENDPGRQLYRLKKAADNRGMVDA